MTATPSDILIAGAGPVGTALAAELARRGLKVSVVDPRPDTPWPNRYGVWARDWVRTRFGAHIQHTYSTVQANAGTGTLTLPGQYLTIDSEGLRGQLRSEAGQTLFTPGRVVQVDTDSEGSTAHLASGERVRASLVIDATGRGHLANPNARVQAFQAAYGIECRVKNSPWSPHSATLMDFSDEHLDSADKAGPCSFLYAMPIAEDRVFVEETSLIAAPAMSLDALRARLMKRLAHLGIELIEELDEERCLFPMDMPIPPAGPVLAVGASAGWVHPATGYHFGRAMAQLEAVAQALAEGLPHSTERALSLARRAVWPTSHRRTRALHDLGQGLLLTFGARDTRRFFDAFFSVPAADQAAYLDATAPPSSVAGAMTRVFSRLSGDLRAKVLRHAIGQGGGHLVRAVAPPPRGVR